jgi:glycosyltransferase involved in cell wall biosynthesis
MTRVLLFATHPASSNGYSKIAFELANQLSQKDDIQLTYYGFQRHMKNDAHTSKRTLPSNVQIYDAVLNEKPGTGHGFGFNEITDFVNINKPDVCIIYNDMVVVGAVIDQLKKAKDTNFKIIVYMDQVYQSQRKEFIKRLNDDADMVLTFSDYWNDCLIKQGVTKPCAVLLHGFNPTMHFPVPKHLARKYLNLNMNDFIVCNLNRNQPRKRLDIMMMAFAEFVSRHISEPIKLIIATSLVGSWNLLEIYERELKIRGVSMEDGMKHLITFDNPQGLTDDMINILYNAIDVGINTAMGEGWGLCNFEAAAVGTPQIISDVGGHKEFFNKNSAILIKPKIHLYTDSSIDGCPGCAEICDYNDFVDALEEYYCNESLRKEHGENARKHILDKYKWDVIGNSLYDYIKKTVAPKEDVHVIPAAPVEEEVPSPVPVVPAPVEEEVPSPVPVVPVPVEEEVPSHVRVQTSNLVSLTEIESLKPVHHLRNKIHEKLQRRKKRNAKDARIEELEQKIQSLMKNKSS